MKFFNFAFPSLLLYLAIQEPRCWTFWLKNTTTTLGPAVLVSASLFVGIGMWLRRMPTFTESGAESMAQSPTAPAPTTAPVPTTTPVPSMTPGPTTTLAPRARPVRCRRGFWCRYLTTEDSKKRPSGHCVILHFETALNSPTPIFIILCFFSMDEYKE